ncbi:uncharacterized protein LOC129273406 [Lytechinus pictus]|uniref:uncharacterized protein LOC129273406 n=1 Tax=Lytechinus pictus TaxID=7653 RepID=UPI0030B9E05E
MHWRERGMKELCVVGLGGSSEPPVFVQPQRITRGKVNEERGSPISTGTGSAQRSVKPRLFTPSKLSNPRPNLPDILDNRSVITIQGKAKALHGNVSTVSCKSGEPNRLSPDVLSLGQDNEKSIAQRSEAEKDSASVSVTQPDAISVSSRMFSERSVPTMATSNQRRPSKSCDLTRNTFSVTSIALTKRGDTSPRSSPTKSRSSSLDGDVSVRVDPEPMPPIGRKGNLNEVRFSEQTPKRFCSKPFPSSRQRMLKNFQEKIRVLEGQFQTNLIPHELQSGSVKAYQRLIIVNQRPKTQPPESQEPTREHKPRVTFAPQTAPEMTSPATDLQHIWASEDTPRPTASNGNNTERKVMMHLNQLSKKYQQEKTVKFALDSPSTQTEFIDSGISNKKRVIPRDEVPRDRLVNHWLSDCPVMDPPQTTYGTANSIPRKKIVLNVPSTMHDVQEES